ncbi:MAG TPA: hypothetical protein VM581_04665, partial [Magnetospirillaceae bacterium]|nr:hypothetical protein [Magnetospirillaceae bacterium]
MKHRLKKIAPHNTLVTWLVRCGIVFAVLLIGLGAWNTLRPLPVVSATVANLPQLPEATTNLTWP